MAIPVECRVCLASIGISFFVLACTSAGQGPALQARSQSGQISGPQSVTSENLSHRKTKGSSTQFLFIDTLQVDSLCSTAFWGRPVPTRTGAVEEEIISSVPEIRQRRYCIAINTDEGFPDSTVFAGMQPISLNLCRHLFAYQEQFPEDLRWMGDSLSAMGLMRYSLVGPANPLPHQYRYVDFGDFIGAIAIGGFVECDTWWREAYLIAIHRGQVRYILDIAAFYQHVEVDYVVSCIDRKRRRLVRYNYAYADIPLEETDSTMAVYQRVVFRLEPDTFLIEDHLVQEIPLLSYDEFIQMVRKENPRSEMDFVW